MLINTFVKRFRKYDTLFPRT